MKKYLLQFWDLIIGKKTVTDLTPIYRILQINNYFKIQRRIGNVVQYMRIVDKTDFSYREDWQIWTDDITNSARYSYLKTAKDFLNFYLSGDWKRPVNKIVHEQR